MATAFDALLGSPPLFDAATRAEFDDDFLHDAQFAAHARKRAKHGLAQSHLRSLHWRLFLDLLSTDNVDLWEGQLALQRRSYDDLLRTYKVTPSAHEEQQKEHDDRERASLTDPSTPPSTVPFPPLPTPPSSASHTPPSSDLKIHNPLSTASSSPWRQYFHNSELSVVIRQDLRRTYPESGFFQHEAIQALMLNVLLVWAKLNAQYEYRQGMNELLAPLVLTVFKDCRAVDPSSPSSTHPVLTAVLDRHYAEHDVFALFKQLMAVMAPFFAKIDQKPLLSSMRAHRSDTDDLLVGPPPPPSTQSPILLKCHHVHHTLLAAADPPLYKHLNAQDVQPQLYGLRWYRLLFAREFHVSDVCAVWDVLLSRTAGSAVGGGGGGGGFVFADYMCVAMLHYVRRELLQGDNTACLRRLLKYPPVEELQTLIDRALYFSTPQQRGGAGLPMLDQPAVHAHHSDIQRFIAEYGSELENSYLEDPLGLKKGGQAVVDGVNRGIDALAKKASKKDSAKTLPAALLVNGHGLQHSVSANNLAPHLSLSAALTVHGHGQPAGKAQQAKASGVMDRVAHLTAVQMEMGQKLHNVVLTLNKEWERVHKATTASATSAGPSQSAPLDDSTASIDSANVSVESSTVEAGDTATHPKDNGGNISVELEDRHSHAHTNGTSAAVSIDMTLLSDSLADLKHIADVLLGRLAYTPSYADAEEDGSHNLVLNAAPSPSSSTPPGLTSPTSSGASAGGVSTFFAPKSVEDPRERLQRLLVEKERETQQVPSFPYAQSGDGLSIHIPHSSSASPLSPHGVSLPAALPPKRLMLPVAAPLLVHTRSASPLDVPPLQASSPSSAPPSRVGSAMVAPTAPTGPSLFDSSPKDGGQSSALALLSSLLGGEKKSVFADD